MEKTNKKGIHPLSDETFEILLQKHPEASEAYASNEILLKETPQGVDLVIYKSINSEILKNPIINTRGVAVPSGMDGGGWCCILISGNFGNVEEDFRKSIAEMAKRMSRKNIKKEVQIILPPF